MARIGCNRTCFHAVDAGSAGGVAAGRTRAGSAFGSRAYAAALCARLHGRGVLHPDHPGNDFADCSDAWLRLVDAKTSPARGDSMSFIECSQLSCQYGAQPVLRELSFTLAQREWIYLAGPSGSG